MVGSNALDRLAMFEALIFGFIFSREDYSTFLVFCGGLNLYTRYSW